ncbi:MAG TPA: proline dehydrogenase family protein [Gemmatimonadales bacterium]|jgi:proline dehydrogenase|nr:proline dehydrogenase family protein [Gemmatimonadales bacterium]
MMRSTLLWLSQRQGMANFVRNNKLASRFAARFVAGETIDDAVRAATELQAKGITVSLDMLGESVHQPDEAGRARDMYIDILKAMRASGLEINASLKPTQMGLDIDPELCERNIRSILDVARESSAFVRLDMEGSAYTQRTLDFFEQRLFPDYGRNTGVVIQAALRRSTDDIAQLNRLGARVRLCKGAYLEPPDVAFPAKKDVDAHYVRLMEALLTDGNYPGIATHDETIQKHARDFVAAHGIARDRFEFQMLYGIRRDLQEQLVKDGYRVRVYVPFGTQWYPYLMRRLAERPANIAFILGSVLKEGSRRS